MEKQKRKGDTLAKQKTLRKKQKTIVDYNAEQKRELPPECPPILQPAWTPKCVLPVCSSAPNASIATAAHVQDESAAVWLSKEEAKTWQWEPRARPGFALAENKHRAARTRPLPENAHDPFTFSPTTVYSGPRINNQPASAPQALAMIEQHGHLSWYAALQRTAPIADLGRQQLRFFLFSYPSCTGASPVETPHSSSEKDKRLVLSRHHATQNARKLDVSMDETPGPQHVASLAFILKQTQYPSWALRMLALPAQCTAQDLAELVKEWIPAREKRHDVPDRLGCVALFLHHYDGDDEKRANERKNNQNPDAYACYAGAMEQTGWRALTHPLVLSPSQTPERDLNELNHMCQFDFLAALRFAVGGPKQLQDRERLQVVAATLDARMLLVRNECGDDSRITLWIYRAGVAQGTGESVYWRVDMSHPIFENKLAIVRELSQATSSWDRLVSLLHALHPSTSETDEHIEAFNVLWRTHHHKSHRKQPNQPNPVIMMRDDLLLSLLPWRQGYRAAYLARVPYALPWMTGSVSCLLPSCFQTMPANLVHPNTFTSVAIRTIALFLSNPRGDCAAVEQRKNQ